MKNSGPAALHHQRGMVARFPKGPLQENSDTITIIKVLTQLKEHIAYMEKKYAVNNQELASQISKLELEIMGLYER